MNLFKKALIAVLGLGLVVAPSANRHVEEVQATKGKGDEKWSLAGTMNGWSTEDTTYEFTYDSKDAAGARYELQISLKVNDEFKVIYNHNSWDIGYGGNTGAGISTYLSNSDGNFKVKTAGDYILWVKDDNVHGYGDKSYGFGIEKYTAVKYTVTYYDGSTQLSTSTVSEGTVLTGGTFKEKEGYRLEGWYTDSALTKKVDGTQKVAANTSVYAKYVEAKDYKIYVKDNGAFGDVAYAYTFSTYDDRNNAWPGAKMTKEDNGYWSYEVDASKSFDEVIFGNGQNEYVNSTLNTKWAQTANLNLYFEDGVYTLGAKDSSKKYTATFEALSTYAAAANLKVSYQENGTSLRIISTLGIFGDSKFSLDSYTSVGFVFNNGEKEVTQESGYVYTSVVANGEDISAEALGGQYFFTATFNNVPSGASLTVTPYATLANGLNVYGTTVTVTVTF